MIIRQPQRTRGRRGSAVVEAALTLTVFCLLLFGVFEYCRYLFVLHMADLAAREAVRYATVNSDKPANFDTVNFTDASGKVYKSVTQYTKDKLGGVDKQLVGYTVAVFAVDPVFLAQTPPVVQAKTGAGVAWNTAGFPDRLAVKITGTFKPFLPNLTQMPTLPVNVIALSGVEG